MVLKLREKTVIVAAPCVSMPHVASTEGLDHLCVLLTTTILHLQRTDALPETREALDYYRRQLEEVASRETP